MTDRYQFLAHTPIGRLVVKNLGLPDPPPLERWTAGGTGGADGQPLVDGTVVLGGPADGQLLKTVQRC